MNCVRVIALPHDNVISIELIYENCPKKTVSCHKLQEVAILTSTAFYPWRLFCHHH